jgi:YbbR domain-containing protein
MTRVLRILVRNWPLKLAAIVLATLLYAGFVLSQSTRQFEGRVPIDTLDQPSDVILLSDLGAVQRIRYFAPDDLGIRLDSASFRATVDLSDVDPSRGPTSVPVRVVSVDPRIQVLEYEPSRVIVQLDRVVSATVPVRAVLGPVPSGLEVGTPVLSVEEANVRGPASNVRRVTEVQARVTIDPSGIDVNSTVDLTPVDALGEPLSLVDVDPTNAQVRVPVFTDRRTKTLPVHPVVTGTPAAGFEVAAVAVDPLSVAVAGDANDLAALELADTASVSVSGASSNVVRTVDLALPDGVQAVGTSSVKVTVTLRAVTATRTFEAGLILTGTRPDLEYALSIDRVLVTIGGSVADLDRLSGSSLTVTVDVTGLEVGAHDVKVGANLQTGLTLVGASPDRVTVTITEPSPSPGPSPTP